MSALHPHGQKVKVHYEEAGDHHIQVGRLYGGYEGIGPVTITVSQDRNLTFSEARVIYVEEIRTSREDF